MANMEDGLPPGFRFHPSDEELLTYYLTRKVSDFGFATQAIADVDLNKCEPWELPGKASMGEKEWYFFSLKDRKYPTGMRTNRATDAGYWKTTGKDKEIFYYGELVGMKKTLVFYKGRAPKGEKTSWVMHEYRLQTKFPCKPSKEEWVVCRVFKKSNNFHMRRLPQPGSPSIPSLHESPGNAASLAELGEIDVSILSNLPNSSGPFNSTQANYIGVCANGSINSSESNKNMDLNLYMNWLYSRPEGPGQLIPPWPSSFLGSNSGPNQATLRALQLSGYQPIESVDAGSVMNSFVGHGGAFFTAHESKLAEPAQQEQQDSSWRGF